MIKAIIFDFQGPLMYEDSHRIIEEFADKRNIDKEIIFNLIRQYFRAAHQGDYKNFADFFNDTKPQIPLKLEELEQILEETRSSIKLRGEMIAIIKRLKSQYKVVLFSNFTADLNLFLKDKFGIYDLFDLVVNSCEIKLKKPDPEAFLYVLKLLELEAVETVYIDDREDNIESAKFLGINTILFKDMSTFEKKLDKILKN